MNNKPALAPVKPQTFAKAIVKPVSYAAKSLPNLKCK